ncbi:MAG: hypothetical protein ACTSWU_02805, partial [Candidatus Thorarchaeota archaeon]
EDEEYVENLANLAIVIAPHMTLVEKLREVQELGDAATLEVLNEVFKDVNIADGAALGQIAKYRVQIIDVLNNHINVIDPKPNEFVLQVLIENSPWLVYPTWHILTKNESFASFRSNFEGWWKDNYGEEIVTSTFDTYEKRRPDFILIHSNEGLLLVEIKKPHHEFNKKDFERLRNYIEGMERYLKENKEIKKNFPRYQIVLICDRFNLSRSQMDSIDLHKSREVLRTRTWREVLTETQEIHRDFISAWKAQQKLAKESTDNSLE